MTMNSPPALQVVEAPGFDLAQQLKEKRRLERNLKLIDIYYRQLMTAPEGSVKMVNALVRYANLILDDGEPGHDQAELYWEFMESICRKMASITPRTLMQAFPLEKTYDGERWESKDYFSSMQAIQEHGMDTPIGNQPIKGLLWDYMNPHIREFVVRYTCCMSAVYRKASGKGIFESWAEQQGMPMYRKGTDEYGREVMVNSQTGEVSPIVKPKPRKPRWWKLIKGGG